MANTTRIARPEETNWLDETLAALDELVEMVFSTLSLCENKYKLDDNASYSKEWLSGEGKRYIAYIRRRIEEATPDVRRRMYASIRAAISAGQHAKQRDMSRPLHRYMLWEWADQIIASVYKSFTREVDVS